jgi:hypothetical protein
MYGHHTVPFLWGEGEQGVEKMLKEGQVTSCLQAINTLMD